MGFGNLFHEQGSRHIVIENNFFNYLLCMEQWPSPAVMAWVFVWVSSSKFVPQTQFGGENARHEKFPFLTEGKNITQEK